jgi:uncharacterized protein YyaL (SSP411 family)
MNRLSQEKSAYLKHSAYQKIDWHPWSEEAFERAKRENKPVFLSTGAIWCHWCHVMAKECFENEEIAGILNERFISMKLDRDERPDVDRRYQRAVSAMGNGSGWPLSVFLTPDKKPFFGGTYFPPEDAHGRPGFKNVLLTVADFYHSKKGEVLEYADNLLDYLKPEPSTIGAIDRSFLEKAERDIMSEFDPQNGGFGKSPKFPMPGAIEFLTGRYFLSGNESAGFAVKKTLEAMAKGGFHDQIGGGFHRYSVDEAWIIPHFEKMADDNAWLLKNYVNAYSLFRDSYFKRVADDIAGFIRTVLSDPEGGFYASQDADVTPDDEGGYFTWTDQDLRKILTGEEYKLLSLYLFHERGTMHHDASKKVLFIAHEAEGIAAETGIDLKRVIEITGLGLKKLLKERDARKAPLIDKTFYTSLNGMLIAACLHASKVLKDPWLRDFPLKSLERIIKSRFINKTLFHSEGVKAVLDDYIYLVEALIRAYEITAERSYLDRARQMMDLCIERFWDENSAGFFDSEEEVLGIRLKAVEDMPHPSSNSLGIVQMLKLSHMTGNAEYFSLAERALRTFSPDAKEMGIHAGSYFCALESFFSMVRLTIGAAPGSELAETAVTFFHPYKSIVYAEERGRVTPCLATGVCLEPIGSAAKLRDFLRHPS